MLEGLLIKAYGGFFYVQEGDRVWELKARGRLRRGDQSLIVGDRVLFTPLEQGTGTLESILTRRNVLMRPRVANVDQLLLVVPLTRPEPDLQLTDRILVCSKLEQIPAMICFNKLDLASQEDVEALLSLYRKAGYQVFATSALRGAGLAALRQAIAGKVSVMAGPSGAGKSTIINALDSRLSQETGEISKKIKRGRHTTRHTELLPVAGGFITDTPGFSNLELPKLDGVELSDYFPEIKSLAGGCRFMNCVHHNEPDCAVKKGLDQGLIGISRYQSYLTFLAELLVKERTYS
ncbi:MAG: ribosome small subunit-dependent GTPase A [Thermacetogeniaceae bacterium]